MIADGRIGAITGTQFGIGGLALEPLEFGAEALPASPCPRCGELPGIGSVG